MLFNYSKMTWFFRKKISSLFLMSWEKSLPIVCYMTLKMFINAKVHARYFCFEVQYWWLLEAAMLQILEIKSECGLLYFL